MTALALRSIGSNDFAVIDDGDRVGRIRLAAERRGEVWNRPQHSRRRSQRYCGEPGGGQDGVPGVLDKVQGGD